MVRGREGRRWRIGNTEAHLMENHCKTDTDMVHALRAHPHTRTCSYLDTYTHTRAHTHTHTHI